MPKTPDVPSTPAPVEILASREESAIDPRAHLAAIVASSDDAIVGKTLDGIVVSWNTGAERVFGYTAAEMIGQPIARLVPEDRRDDLPAILSAIRRGDRVDHYETERIRKDGERIYVSLTVSPVRDTSGRVIGASKVARDVTDRRRTEVEREELLRATEEARARAEEADRAKDEFLAMLAHELRNPLAALRNGILAAQLDTGRGARALDIARRQADNLSRLVDDLLDVARFTRGQISLRLEKVRLRDVVERSLETLHSTIEGLGHHVTVSVEPPDLTVEGDPGRLEQVVENLLSNAAKYTPPGGEIEVQATLDGGDALLVVRDSGIGIDLDMQPRVFDLFAQAERGLDRREGGLGIGLTLVRRVVELHGGHVEVRSAGIGAGSEFRIRLAALPADGPREESVTTAEEGEEGANILLVEDNIDAAASLKMLLELHGHQVAVSHDGESAIRLAEDTVPDLMLIDIGLPVLDGYEVAHRLRGSEKLRGVTMVALTGYGREEDRERALQAGFDRHLVKPADPDEINEIARLSREARASRPH